MKTVKTMIAVVSAVAVLGLITVVRAETQGQPKAQTTQTQHQGHGKGDGMGERKQHTPEEREAMKAEHRHNRDMMRSYRMYLKDNKIPAATKQAIDAKRKSNQDFAKKAREDRKIDDTERTAIQKNRDDLEKMMEDAVTAAGGPISVEKGSEHSAKK